MELIIKIDDTSEDVVFSSRLDFQNYIKREAIRSIRLASALTEHFPITIQDGLEAIPDLTTYFQTRQFGKPVNPHK